MGPVESAPSASQAKANKARRAAKRKVLRQKLTGVHQELKETRAELRQTKREERNINNEIAEVENRINRTEKHLANVKQRIAQIDKQTDVLETRIDLTQKRLDNRRRVLARRVRDNYQRGNTSYMQVLLRSRSVHDYMSRSYYVERIVESDKKLVDDIKKDKKALEADKKELDLKREQQEIAKADLENSYAQYKADVIRKRELLEEVREDRAKLEMALNELEESSREIEWRIRQLLETPRGRARSSIAFTGGFIKPADGPVTSRFGMRHHPILGRSRMHNGVDIGAGYGSSIYAAATGEVIFSGYMRGYGNTVVIDHGGGISTLYGHCSALLVNDGQTVSKGQIIARVGSTGMSTGPHLHWEVRRNGSPVNPL
jgi:murein DD-endopeptidase MepM/ murein hydrolase activator NlpD